MVPSPELELPYIEFSNYCSIIMKRLDYQTRTIFLTFSILCSIFFAAKITSNEIHSWVYFGIVFMGGLFLLINRWTTKDEKNPNQGIRRLMISSMIRLFVVVIYLGISLYNFRPLELKNVLIYVFSFLLYLFFDIYEMRTKLRPDSEKSND